MNANNKIIRATAVVFGFWWLIFTLWSFGGSPMLFISNWAFVGTTVSRWALGVMSGLVVGVWFIWFSRITAMNRLYKGKGGTGLNGVRSTLGSVPMPITVLPRVDGPSKRLPIKSEPVNAWLAQNAKKWPAHVALFWAVWDTYSASPSFPASHRKGGHGNRRLWQHCLAVAENALLDAGGYVFEGVYVKARGKPKFKIIDLKNKEYRFDATDPLIPILALAHDIGKLEAYVIAEDGSVVTQEEGGALTPQDDNRISHDALGARILARFPEYWALPPRDRSTINLVIAHYHHPSSFPVARNGLSLDDRMTALMEFLILVDKKTGMAESSITENLSEQEITEDESSTIYHSFVEIISEFGRVNGTGDQAKDSTLKIAQKHDGLIVVKEKDLRMLILAKMGWSLEEGDGRYRLTLNLMSTLQEKGLLYSTHNNGDMSRFVPMYSVAFRNAQTGAHLTTWEPCIIFRPVATTPELAALSGLPNMNTKLDIERPLFTHNLGITDAESLRQAIAQGFTAEIAAKTNIGGKQETKPQPVAAAPVAPVVPPIVSAPAPVAPPQQTQLSPPATIAAPPAIPLAQPPVVPVAQPPVVPATEPVAGGGGTNEAVVTSSTKPDEADAPLIIEIPCVETDTGGMDADEFEIDQDAVLPDDDLQALTESLGTHADDNDDADFMAFVDGQLEAEDIDDAFGAFTAQQMPAPQETVAPAALEPVAPPTTLVAVAIPDPDAQPSRRISPAAEAAALKALDEAPDFTTFVMPRRKKKSVVNQMAKIRAAVDSKEIPVCGTKDGFDYLLEADLMAFDPELDVKALIKSEKLPTVEAKPGCLMVGIPVAPLQLDL